MESIQHLTKNKWSIIRTDILVLAMVYLIPAISHLLPFPLYFLDPMRLLLFAGYLIGRNSTNAYFLALTIPLFSSIISGHPPFYKALLISMELLVNIWCLHFILRKIKWPVIISVFLSIVISKLVYYSFKFAFIKLTLVHGSLISTSILFQLAIVVFLSVIFTLFYKRLQPEIE